MQAKKILLTTLAFVALSTAPALHAAPAKAVHKAAPAKATASTSAVRDYSHAIEFAQAHSDVAADPAVIFGRLPNGFTYEIMKNATPPGRVSLRLRVNGGSMMEHEEQRGLAHFIEHMAFNGSKNVAEGDMLSLIHI